MIFSRYKWPDVAFDEIRKRSQILVIDDQDFPYEALFSRDGYKVEKWDDVRDLTKLESGYYDIVLLDIQGVGRKESEGEQGLGVLKHIRNVNPAQLIVAYSSSDWALKYQEFFRMADAALDKRGDYVVFKRTVDDLLRARFSLGFYVDRILAAAKDQGVDSAKLRLIAERAILSSDVTKLAKFLRSHTVTIESSKIILQLASIGIQIYKICAGV